MRDGVIQSGDLIQKETFIEETAMTRMVRRRGSVLVFWVFISVAALSVLSAQETFPIWPGPAPGETGETAAPELVRFKPAIQRSDASLIVFPGGGYRFLSYDFEGTAIAQFFNAQGMNVVVLKYRVPRRNGLPKHLPAWQDAQRTIRQVRAKADEWKIDPEKIGVIGFSAGGHLALMAATSSLTPAYEPIDPLDQIPCHVNYAVPVYPAYVFAEKADNMGEGEQDDGPITKDFVFDARTPPICLIHGDRDDDCSPAGSIAVYQRLRAMKISTELHVYAGAGHGFGARPNDEHLGDWLNRVCAWMKGTGIF